MLEGIGAQAAAALDRDRLRTQAAQAEALGEANRVRTALLTAVSHDLRTPLASIKAAISSLRQDDVTWSPEDEATLLATIEEGSDRLEGLINNLLDMSRVHTGSLQPFLRPTALDEVVPLALRGLAGADTVVLDLPDSLPLIATDAGLARAGGRQSRRQCPAVLPAEPAGGGRRPGGRRIRPAVGHRPRPGRTGPGPGAHLRAVPASRRPFDRRPGSGSGSRSRADSPRRWAGRSARRARPGGGLTMTVELRANAVVSAL